MSKSLFQKILDLFYVSPENKEMMIDHIRTYFSKKDYNYQLNFQYTIQDKDIRKRVKSYSLKDSKDYLIELKDIMEDDFDEDASDGIEFVERKLDVLSEVELFYKFFHTKKISFDYPILFSIFDEFFKRDREDRWEMIYGDRIKLLIKNHKKPSENEIIDAIITEYLDDPEPDFDNVPVEIILFYLDKLGYKMSKNKIQSVGKKMMKDKRFKKFKNNFE